MQVFKTVHSIELVQRRQPVLYRYGDGVGDVGWVDAAGGSGGFSIPIRSASVGAAIQRTAASEKPT
jgi:hypothetical protein